MKYMTNTAISLIFISLLGAGCAQAQNSPELNTAQVEAIVKDYLLENPEIIREALIKLQEKEELQKQQDSKDILRLAADEIYNDPRDMSLGPKNAKVTIVEFFDYNCGFCKKSTGWVKDVLKENPDDVRFVFKELPILDARNKTSRNAAKAALAAGRQGEYETMHFMLMSERGLTAERVRSMAEKAKLDMDKFDKDMLDPALDKHIDDTIRLAQRIPSLTGTPFFIIGDEYVPGANTEILQEMLKKALS